MIEIKGLSKTYNTKGGSVRALRNVTLKFEDRGMVFILGKSGSGKSTLLNLIGGLDRADGGEIVIDGKSAKFFKGSDYDAYRNEYIGFVFQEYNLLDDFTVGENVSLALELQGKKADKTRLEKALEEVEMEGYADRKVNELSGGQRQRVAIARAMIKDPRILLADEPTGALDSNTADCVFETLKKLSLNKLVIVVSHDREFAERYGDRIIEIADGRVADDVCLTESAPAPKASKLNFEQSRLPIGRAVRIGIKSAFSKPIRLAVTILLCLVSFAFLGLADTFAAYNKSKAAVNSIIENAYDSLAIDSSGGVIGKDIEYIKDKTGVDMTGVAMLDDEPQALSFMYASRVKGNETTPYYNASLYGYLPVDEVVDKYSLIAGRKPIGEDEIVVSKYIYEQFALGGSRVHDGDAFVYTEPENISSPEAFVCDTRIEVSLGNESVVWKVVGIVDTQEDRQGRYASLKPSSKDNLSLEKFEILSNECKDYFEYSYHSLGYVARQVYEYMCELRSGNGSVGSRARGKFSFARKDIDGTEIKYSANFENAAGSSHLQDLEIIWADGNERTTLQNNEFVVGVDFLNEVGKSISGDSQVILQETFFQGDVNFNSLNLTLSALKEFAGLFVGAFDCAEKVQESQLVAFKQFINSIGSGREDEERQMLRALAINECFENVIRFLTRDTQIDIKAEDFSDWEWRILYAGYLMCVKFDFYGMYDTLDGGYVFNVVQGQPSGEELNKSFGEKLYAEYLLKEIAGLSFYGLTIDFVYGDGESITRDISPKIAGVCVDSDSADCVVNDLVYACAQTALTPEFAFAIASMPQDRKTVKSLIDIHFDENAQRRYFIHNSVTGAIWQKGETFQFISKVFLYAGLGLALFSVALMSNYIAVSIDAKKKQIGILRAMGAKTRDVFAIFCSESLILAFINFVLATLSAFIATLIMGAQLAADFGLQITFVFFGIRQISIVFAVSFATALAASLIPIYKLSKKKPIDCILDN